MQSNKMLNDITEQPTPAYLYWSTKKEINDSLLMCRE